MYVSPLNNSKIGKTFQPWVYVAKEFEANHPSNHKLIVQQNRTHLEFPRLVDGVSFPERPVQVLPTPDITYWNLVSSFVASVLEMKDRPYLAEHVLLKTRRRYRKQTMT